MRIRLVSVLVDDQDRFGVAFTTPPTDMGTVSGAILDETCGNLILIYSS